MCRTRARHRSPWRCQVPFKTHPDKSYRLLKTLIQQHATDNFTHHVAPEESRLPFRCRTSFLLTSSNRQAPHRTNTPLYLPQLLLIFTLHRFPVLSGRFTIVAKLFKVLFTALTHLPTSSTTCRLHRNAVNSRQNSDTSKVTSRLSVSTHPKCLGLRVYAVRQVDRRNYGTVITVLTSLASLTV